MVILLLVSLIWAFSFGLIKGNLAGLDSNFVSFARMLVSLLVFLPFIRLKKISWKLAIKLAVTGALQFGVMYITYVAAFKTLQAFEVALFTIFTPIYVTLIEDATRKKFNPLFLLTATLAVAGTWVIKQGQLLSPEILNGFLLVQVSNLCFAFGQVYYRRLMAVEEGVKDSEVFGVLYIGAVLVTLVATLVFVPVSSIVVTTKQTWTLLYLGAVASGLGFFLWNFGARKVNAGALAIFNDFKIPLAIAVSLLVFGEKTNLPALLIGGGIILLSLLLNEVLARKRLTKPE
jgi:drug/metabolite transporter (DMT)-like permease